MAVDLEAPFSPKRGRTRSPAYPYIALPNALEKAAVLWQVEGRHAAAVNVAMQHWGYKEDSSTGYSCVAALKKFGLVDHEGMGDTRQVKLSDLALTILLDKDPESDERKDALRAAALGPRIHAELWERYGTELPSDPSLKRYLVLERGFNEAAVDEFLDEYKQTMTFAGMNVGTGAAAPHAAAGRPPALAGAVGSTAAPPSAGRVNGLAINSAPVAASGRAPERRPDAPPQVPRASQRPLADREGPWHNERVPAPRHAYPVDREEVAQRQRGLFDEEGDAYRASSRTDTPPTVAAPAGMARDEEDPRSGGPAAPWSVARKELPVPLDNDLVARVPYPMTEEDFELLIGTLQLWKKRLVQP